MEIERKYIIDTLPKGYWNWPFHQIEQAYLCTAPTVRIRQEDDTYYMTYKSGGLLAREEYNLPLTKEAYEHLLAKADGIVLTKKRYLIPLNEAQMLGTPAAGKTACGVNSIGMAACCVNSTDTPACCTNLPDTAACDANSPDTAACDASLTVELDLFEGVWSGLVLAEVEFPTEEAARAFIPPAWFGRDVTFTGEYSNSRLAMSPPSP